MEAEKGKGGFKVPEGYFERLADRISERLGPEFPSDAGFRVPEGYFESLTDRVSLQTRPDPKVRVLRNTGLYWISGAAAVLLIALFLRLDRKPDTPTFGDLAGADIQAYLEANDRDLNAYELAENLPLGRIALSDVLESVPEETAILDYLVDDTEVIDDLNWNGND